MKGEDFDTHPSFDVGSGKVEGTGGAMAVRCGEGEEFVVGQFGVVRGAGSVGDGCAVCVVVVHCLMICCVAFV